MGVIGRLDDQVNEKIIKPVGARNRPESKETEAPMGESRPRPQPASVTDRAQDEENPKTRTQSELPVWLL